MVSVELEPEYELILNEYLKCEKAIEGDIKVQHVIYPEWDDPEDSRIRSRINVWLGEKIVRSCFIIKDKEQASVSFGIPERKIVVELPKEEATLPQKEAN